MRGEYWVFASVIISKLELPPRARRIPAGSGPPLRASGTTSACAENTGLIFGGCNIEAELPPRARRIPPPTHTKKLKIVNYLRVRGEYCSAGTVTDAVPELPPRARRIPFHLSADDEQIGTTSACAENTMRDFQSRAITGNYLRVRGEYPTFGRLHTTEQELPPRARRIRAFIGGGLSTIGTTSACAENTPG